MTVAVKRPMTASEFLDWAESQSAGRYELVGGEVIAMSPERARHVRTKAACWLALAEAIKAAGLPCEAFTDGIAVVIDELTTREPDALVQCGKPIAGDSLVADAPIILVEVVSPAGTRSDTGAKLAEYFSLPTVQHYLIVDPVRRVVIHHQRGQDGEIRTHVRHDGELGLVPPGITLPVTAMFGSA